MRHGKDRYTVECFLSRRALVKPRLVPGRYIALNFSLNRDDTSDGPGWQWSASQKLQTWRRPDTWGDLLLLGSDAKLAFVEPSGTAEEAEPMKVTVPGSSVGLRVTDVDMNLNTLRVDRILSRVEAAHSRASVLAVLSETGPNTGVFEGSIDTQPFFLPPAENVLNVRSGEKLELVYTDARTEYGETNRERRASLPVGWPVLKLGAR